MRLYIEEKFGDMFSNKAQVRGKTMPIPQAWGISTVDVGFYTPYKGDSFYFYFYSVAMILDFRNLSLTSYMKQTWDLDH